MAASKTLLYRAFICSFAVALAGCPSSHRPGGVGGVDAGGGMGNCGAGCVNCGAGGKCTDCVGASACMGIASVVACNPDGTFGAVMKTCDATNNERCSAGNCLSACDIAATNHSYIACDYWPVTTLTSQLNPYFDFAVAVANPLTVGDVTQSAPATVTVSRGGMTIATQVVQPGTVQTIILPWVKELAQNPTDCASINGCGPVVEKSASVPNGAYHLVSTLPVSVYQFSPLQFEKPTSASCFDYPKNANNKTCHSYTNDASLLLPTTVLKNEYIVVSRGSFTVGPRGNVQSGSTLPGFFSVYGTVDNTTVTITYSGYSDAGPGVPAQAPGDTVMYKVNAGQVLQIISKRSGANCTAMSSDTNYSYCDLGPTYDLTGSHIVADQPIGVFGGHACAFVPYNKFACDHLETQIFPLETWGQKIIVAQTTPQITGEPNIFRIVSGADNNSIMFDPPSVHAPIVLQTGKYIEFTAQGGFEAIATNRIAVAQYMVGQHYEDPNAVPAVGDPSLGLGIPVEQYRNSYDFLTPSTYTKSYVNIIAPSASTDLTLDMVPVPGTFTPIGGTNFGYLQLPIQPGAHHLTSANPFGITVSGVASFTSYLYAGGLNLNSVVIIN